MCSSSDSSNDNLNSYLLCLSMRQLLNAHLATRFLFTPQDPAKEEMIRELNAEYGCLEYASGRKRDPNGGHQETAK